MQNCYDTAGWVQTKLRGATVGQQKGEFRWGEVGTVLNRVISINNNNKLKVVTCCLQIFVVCKSILSKFCCWLRQPVGTCVFQSVAVHFLKNYYLKRLSSEFNHHHHQLNFIFVLTTKVWHYIFIVMITPVSNILYIWDHNKLKDHHHWGNLGNNLSWWWMEATFVWLMSTVSGVLKNL